MWVRIGRVSEKTTAEQPTSARRPLQDGLNPATLRGGFAVFLGALVLLMPGLSVTIVAAAVGAAVFGSGLYDLWYGLTGRRRGQRRPSRLLALVRAPFSLLFVVLFVVAPGGALSLLVGLVGIYVGVRGLLLLWSALLPSRREGRGPRAAAGLAAVGLGVLAFFAPETLADGLIVGCAIAAILVGGIVLDYGVRGYRNGYESDLTGRPVIEIVWDWVRSGDIGEARRRDLADTLYFEEPARGSKLLAWWVMLALSVTIATYGVLQDSTAVVIGAMLIAPLMVPILGLAGALVNTWQRRAAQSAALIAAGVAAAVLLSYALSAWAPVAITFDTNTQITSRVSPSLPDMMIAVAAGAAGAFATVHPRVASSIAGVAIAVALVPPLAVVGVGLGQQRYADAGGALLLFLTNFVAIVLAAAAVFALGGFARAGHLRERLREVLTTVAPFAALAAVILVPLVFTSEGLLATATAQRQATDVVEQWLEGTPDVHVTSIEVRDDKITVELSGPGDPPSVDSLQQNLIKELARPIGLTVVVVPVTVHRRDVPALEDAGMDLLS